MGLGLLLVVSVYLRELLGSKGREPLHLDVLGFTLGIFSVAGTQDEDHSVDEIHRLDDNQGAHQVHDNVIGRAQPGSNCDGDAETNAAENIEHYCLLNKCDYIYR